MQIVEWHAFNWNKKTKWEEEHELSIVKEDPFEISWNDSNIKERFFQKQLTEEEHSLFQLMRAYSHVFTNHQADILAYQHSVHYREDLHARIMNLIEKRNPRLYRSLRLLDVTGACLTGEKRYTEAFQDQLNEFLNEERIYMKEKIIAAIETDLRRSYEEWMRNQKG